MEQVLDLLRCHSYAAAETEPPAEAEADSVGLFVHVPRVIFSKKRNDSNLDRLKRTMMKREREFELNDTI